MGPERQIVGVWQGVVTFGMGFRESFSEDVTFVRDLNDEESAL